MSHLLHEDYAVRTTGEVAEILGVEEWRVRRLFEDGTIPEPSKFGGKRVLRQDLIPAIVDALRARGWLPTLEEEAQRCSR